MEQAIETVINQFHCYAVQGRKEYLTPNELKELVGQKLPHLGNVRAARGTALGQEAASHPEIRGRTLDWGWGWRDRTWVQGLGSGPGEWSPG